MNLPVIILKGLVLLPNNDIRIDFENKSIIDEAEMLHDKKILGLCSIIKLLFNILGQDNFTILQETKVVSDVAERN